MFNQNIKALVCKVKHKNVEWYIMVSLQLNHQQHLFIKGLRDELEESIQVNTGEMLFHHCSDKSTILMINKHLQHARNQGTEPNYLITMQPSRKSFNFDSDKILEDLLALPHCHLW